MMRDKQTRRNIAILATGDELSNGDIVNTNTQKIAQLLFDQGMQVGMHMVVSDNVPEIKQAILFLLETHHSLIITGGLGPTSDDITRFALTQATHRTLVFHEETWQAIANRLKRFGYDTPPESNRQQALFPSHATIIPNPAGTAAGCILDHENHFIFMLPGPPNECLPMVEDTVLATLKQHHYQYGDYRKKWLLFGVSEGHIAETLDAIATPYECTTGYRLCYPYIEFKLHSTNKKNFAKVLPLIEAAIAAYLIGKGDKTASALFIDKLQTFPTSLSICDLATGGSLEACIKTPDTQTKLAFTYDKQCAANLLIQGLDAFWKKDMSTVKTTLELQFNLDSIQETLNLTIPFRDDRVKQYAVELTCSKMITYMGII